MNDTSLTLSRGLSSFRRWLAPPVFDDEDKTRAAAIFNPLILSVVALWLGLLAVRVTVGVYNPRTVPIGLIACALLLGIREMARRGHVWLAVTLFCSVLLLAFSLIIYNNGTVRAMGTATMIGCVVVATMLLGPRRGFIFVGLTVAVVFGLAQMEIAGALPSLSTPTLAPISQWLTLTAIILFHWALVSVARNSLTEALTRARHENAACQHAEENLRELNASLETHVAERTAELELEILERKRMEETLRVSDERLSHVLNNMVEGGQIIGHDWRYLYVNDAVAIQGRHTPQELLGRTMLEMYPGIETTELFATLQRCMEDRIHHQMLNEFTYPDGSQGWFELSIQPVPEGIFILSNDITARKQAEELLRASEERYRDLIDVSPNAIFVHSEERLVFVNPAAAKLLGAAHSGELIGKPIWEIIHPDYHQIVRKRIQQIVQGQQIPPQEEKFVRLDGPSVDVEVTARPLVYQNQPAVQAIAQNITDRKLAEEKLRASEERLNLALTGANEGYWDWNVQTGEAYFSPRWKAMIGYADDELPNNYESWDSSLHPEDKPNVLQALQEHLDDESRAYAPEFRMLTKAGEWLWIRARGRVAERDHEGHPLRMAGTHADITARKQMEELLRRSESAYANLLKNIAGAVYRCRNDKDWTVEYISEGCTVLMGYAPMRSSKAALHPWERSCIPMTWNPSGRNARST